MKINKSELREWINGVVGRKLEESLLGSEIIPGGDGKLAAYAKKVESFLDDTIEQAEKLSEEGEDLMKANVLQDTLVGERNRVFLSVIGYLRKLRFNVAATSIDLRKSLG